MATSQLIRGFFILMKILRLTLKRKWFDLIKSGEKTEEYREIKHYWIHRLCEDIEHYEVNYWEGVYKKYTHILFVNGYSKESQWFKIQCNGIEIGEGKPEWGAEPGKKYFIIKLGKILTASEQKEPANAIA